MFVYDAGRAIGTERRRSPSSCGFFERRDLFLVSRESGMAFPEAGKTPQHAPDRWRATAAAVVARRAGATDKACGRAGATGAGAQRAGDNIRSENSRAMVNFPDATGPWMKTTRIHFL